MNKSCIVADESFISRDDAELKENIQKAMDEYIRLAAENGRLPEKESEPV